MTAIEQIKQLALAGVGRRNAEAAVGRPFTDEELTAFRAAHVRWQLLEKKRKLEKGGPKTAAELNAAMVARRADLAADLAAALPLVKTRRRDACAKSLAKFAATYCVGEGGFLEVAPPKAMQGILDEMQAAIGDASMPYHIRVARGHGKTSYTKCAVAWVLAYGLRRYVVAVSADARKASGIITDLQAFFSSAPKFCEDFPEISVPIRRLGGAFQRAKSQTCRGVNTNIRMSAQEMRLPTIADETGAPYPASGAILASVGITGNARGLVRGALRPDLLLLDDLQNDAMARSEERVLETAQTIRKSFLGLAGHRKTIAAIMTSTPIYPDDLSETFAADKAWRTSTYKMVTAWPSCFRAEGRADLWQEYADIYQRAMAEGRAPHLAANRFYTSHRAEMDDGAAVLNADNYDRKTERSGIQHAMNILYRVGFDAFMGEYQMEPPRDAFAFEITAKMILSRVRKGAAPHVIPPGSVLTVAATDINPGYAITTTVIAFDVQLTAQVVAYHATPVKIPERLNDTAFGAAVYTALAAHGREIAALGVRIDRWGIDAGGKQFPAVTRFAPSAEAEIGLKAIAMLGRAGQNWNPNVRSRIRAERNGTVLCADPQHRRWLAWNADEHKERAQRAWATETGAPGGLSLFDGGVNHYKFAAQIANEKLKSKTRIKGKDGRDAFAYEWRTRNPHDYGDCVAMCYALASSEGLTPDGMGAVAAASAEQGFEIL